MASSSTGEPRGKGGAQAPASSAGSASSAGDKGGGGAQAPAYVLASTNTWSRWCKWAWETLLNVLAPTDREHLCSLIKAEGPAYMKETGGGHPATMGLCFSIDNFIDAERFVLPPEMLTATAMGKIRGRPRDQEVKNWRVLHLADSTLTLFGEKPPGASAKAKRPCGSCQSHLNELKGNARSHILSIGGGGVREFVDTLRKPMYGPDQWDAIVVTWNFNDLLARPGGKKSKKVWPNPPLSEDHKAKVDELCTELSRYARSFVITGGSSRAWEAPPHFDDLVTAVRHRIRSRGIPSTDGSLC